MRMRAGACARLLDELTELHNLSIDVVDVVCQKHKKQIHVVLVLEYQSVLISVLNFQFEHLHLCLVNFCVCLIYQFNKFLKSLLVNVWVSVFSVNENLIALEMVSE